MTSTSIWILVGNRSQAKIYATQGLNNLQEIKAFAQPEARLKGKEILDDAPGRSFDSHSSYRHTVGPEDLHLDFIEQFSQYLAKFINHKRSQRAFDCLIIIAEPQFLGRLRCDLDAPTKKTLVGEISKDVVQEDAATIHRLAEPHIRLHYYDAEVSRTSP